MMRLLVCGLAAILAFGSAAHAETCVASWYGSESGTRNANGSHFNPMGRSAAHRYFPFGTMLRVTHAGHSVDLPVLDRGPFVRGRCLDLSKGAALAIGMTSTAIVTFERLESSLTSLAPAPLWRHRRVRRHYRRGHSR